MPPPPLICYHVHVCSIGKLGLHVIETDMRQGAEQRFDPESWDASVVDNVTPVKKRGVKKKAKGFFACC